MNSPAPHHCHQTRNGPGRTEAMHKEVEPAQSRPCRDALQSFLQDGPPPSVFTCPCPPCRPCPPSLPCHPWHPSPPWEAPPQRPRQSSAGKPLRTHLGAQSSPPETRQNQPTSFELLCQVSVKVAAHFAIVQTLVTHAAIAKL